MSKDKPTKREHIIPEFYLEGFSEDKKAWVIDFHSDKEPYRTTINNILCISNFYNIESENSVKDDAIEQKFSQVESDAKPVIDNIRNKMVLPLKQDKRKLAIFLASLYVRSPLQRQMQLEMVESMIHNLFQRHAFFKTIYPKYVSRAENPIDEATAKALLKDCNVEGCLSNEAYIKMMLQLWPTVTTVFDLMNWNVYFADPSKPQKFITGDFPFVIENKENHEFELPRFLFANKYIKLYIPLSPLTCLTLEYNSNQEFHAIESPKYIPIINSQVAVHSQRYVVSQTDCIYWYKDGQICNSMKLLHKEFYPQKLNKPVLEVSNLQGYYEPAKPRPHWNKLKGDKRKDVKKINTDSRP